MLIKEYYISGIPCLASMGAYNIINISWEKKKRKMSALS